MKNNTALNNQKQANSNKTKEMSKGYMLNLVSLGAVSDLAEITFELSRKPLQALSRLHTNLQNLYNQKRDKYAIDMLHMIYSVVGSDYAEAVILLHKSIEARNSFLYDYIENLGEYLEEQVEIHAEKNNILKNQKSS